MKRLLILLVLVFVLTGGSIFAQDSGQTDTLVITWPPPVTEVWSVGDVLGTANIPNMVYHYLEYVPLNDDLSIPENAPWLPATVANREAVVDGVLATLDTKTVADGLYALRLTASTVDGQVYHYTVSPIRVDNARFQAVEARLRAEGAPAAPEATVAPPADNTPRVVPSGTAVNVRRCDLVDNDRCPVIVQLPPGNFAEITGRNPSNTFYQVRLASGVSGWASRTVVIESGDVSTLPVANPPAPLPAPIRVQPIAPIGVVGSSAIPNGIAVQGNAVCNQTFNVQINLANTSGNVAQAGSVTLQDVNVGTGTITFTGSANYPAINPGGNFVVAIPVTTSTYYNEQHELRAYSNGQQVTTRYTLGQGNCNPAPQPARPAGTGRSFAPGECTLVINTAELSATIDGEVTFLLQDAGNYPALQVQPAGGVNWYEISFADAPAWLPSPNVAAYQGNCNP
ncbi:MAG: hypothetical protein IT320_00515 [Anaerolineae bacterium]|nr:hypothetical protein [Anaerolineae bacterium]